MNTEEDPYPLHTKLKAAIDSGEHAHIVAFIEWTQHAGCNWRIMNGQMMEDFKFDSDFDPSYMFLTDDRIGALIGAYFGIDRNGLEREKVRMLNAQRELNRQVDVIKRRKKIAASDAAG